MGQITNIKEFTDYWRNKYPSVYRNQTDKDIIASVRTRYPHLNIPTYEQALTTTDQEYVEDTGFNDNSEDLRKQKTDPDWVDSWYLTGDLMPEKWKEEGFMGISPNFFRQAFNNSMAGNFYKTVKGEEKWETDPGYEASWYGQAGQFALGLFSPLDALTMVGTGMLGKGAALVGRTGLFGRGAGAKYLKRGVLSNIASKYPKVGVAAMNTVEGALSLGVGGGTFAASHAMLTETARQRMENPDKPVNISKALKVASDEFLHAAPMFAIAGGVTQGIMGSIYGYSTAYAAKNPSYTAKLTQAATSPLARVGTEAALFTSLPSMLGDEDAPKFNTPEWWAGLGTNTLIVGAMRAVGSFAEPKGFDAYKFVTSEIKLENNIKRKNANNNKEVIDRVGPENAPKESLDIVKEYMISEGKLKVDIKTFKDDLKFIKKMNIRIEDPAYVEKIGIKGSKESIEFAKYSEKVNEYSTGINGIADKVLKDDVHGRELYKEMYGEYPTESQFARFKGNIKGLKSTTEEARTWLDDYLAGNVRQSTDGINGGDPGPPPQPVRRTTIGGMTREEAKASGGMSDKVIIEQGKKLGVEVETTKPSKRYPKGKVKNRKQVIERIYNQQKYKDLKITQQGQTIATEVVEQLGVFREPQQQRRLDIDKPKYETFIKSKNEFKNKSYPEKTRESIIKDIVDKVSKISNGDNLLEVAILNSLKSIKGKKDAIATSTLKSYSSALESYIKYLKKRGIDFFDVNDTVLRDFLTKDGKKKALGDIDLREAASIRNLYKWMGSKSGYNLRFDPSEWISNIFNAYNKKAKLRKKDLPDYQNWNKSIDSILSDFKKKKNNREVYDRAEVFLEVGNQTGIRNQEWFTQDYPGVRVKDIFHIKDGKEIPGLNTKEINFIKISPETSKTGTERYVPLTPKSTKSIKKLIDEYKLKSDDLLVSDKFKQKIRDIVNKELKSKISEKTNIDDWRDIAQQTATYGAELSPRELQLINNMLGHQMTAIEKIYLKDVNIERIVKDTYNAVIKIQEAQRPIFKEKRTTRLESEIVFQSKGDKAVVQKAREKFLRKFAKKNNLSEAQLKETLLGEGVFGEWVEAADGAIRLQKGIWQPSDFFHENVHRLKAFARKTNNKSLMRLIERGESLAKQTKEYKEWKKKNVNRNVEEFLADIAGGKASRMEFAPSLAKKVSQFVKQIVSKIKIAFGAGNFNDYANVVARRVRKGFSTEGIEFTRNQVKYSMEGMTPEAAVKYVRNNLKQIFKDKEISESNMKAVVRHIGEVSGLGKNFKLSKLAEIPELEQFSAYLNTMNPSLIKRIPDKVNWFETWKEAEQIRVLKNVKESERKSLLKDLEVLDGDMFNATTQQLRDFIQIVQAMDDVKLTTTSWIDQAVSERSLNKSMADRFKNISRGKWALPIDFVLESVGLGKLADRMRTHTSAELRYIGEFSSFEKNAQRLFVSKTDPTGKRKWNKVKDFIAMIFDKERYFERLEKGYLTDAQKKFANEIFDINVEAKTMTPKNTKEAYLVKSYKDLMKYYKEAFIGKDAKGTDGALREVLNEAQFEKFMNDKNIKWLDDNIYVQRRLTKEFKKYYDPYGRHFENLIKEQTDGIATKLTERFFKNKKPTQKEFTKKYESFLDDANAMAHAELYEMFGFNPGKYSPSFLKERHVKLPEKLKLDGKYIEVYETGFGATIKDYSVNQAKFLANIEFFPEFVKLKGFNIPGSKALIKQIEIKDRYLGDWVDKRIKDHLQVDKKIGDYPEGIRIVRYTTSLAAKFQLSFPTSGLKNFLIGQTQTMLAYRLRDYFKGFADIIYKDNRDMVRASGATEIGMRHFETGSGLFRIVDNFAEKGFFKFGLMRPSENINRYVSVMAGKRDQLHLTRVIRGAKEGSRRYNAAINKLKKFYKLNDKDIALLKEFGLNGVEGLSPAAAAKNKRALDALYQKMNTFAHINTQGAALNLFMPDWTGSPLAQSALLYKRMAYAATVNTTRNLTIAWKNKSLLQPLMFGLGAYVSGEALIAFYDKLLGQSMPAENSKEGRYLKTVLYKGEMLGILSDFLSPFGPQFVNNSLYPSLMSTATLMYNTFGQILQGKEFVSVGLNDIMKGTSGLYNNTSKLFKQGLLSKDSYVSKDKRSRALFSEMLREYNDRDGMILNEENEGTFETTKYMKAYKEAFKAGSVEEAGKWYVMALFAKVNDYMVAGITENGQSITTPQQAFKAAVSGMKTTLTNLNPNQRGITAKRGTKAWKSQAAKWIQFQQWLDRDFNAGKSKEKLSDFILNTQGMYFKRRRDVEKAAVQYINSANLKKDLKYYGFKIADLF